MDRNRAEFALVCAESVGQDLRKKYASVAVRAPVQVLTNGLPMALAFWESKGDDEVRLLLRHVCQSIQWMLLDPTRTRPDPARSNQAAPKVLKALLGQDQGDLAYLGSVEGVRHATQEALAFLNWLKRMVSRKGYEP